LNKTNKQGHNGIMGFMGKDKYRWVEREKRRSAEDLEQAFYFQVHRMTKATINTLAPLSFNICFGGTLSRFRVRTNGFVIRHIILIA